VAGVALAACLASCAPQGTLVTARPYKLIKPKAYDGTKPSPLLILLHGYMDGGDAISRYFGFEPIADERGFLYAHPDGTFDSVGNQFWNATDACCNYEGSRVDDVAYLTAVLDDIEAHSNVDKSRVYFVGHSNGGFMTHRMACELSPRIAAVVSLAGANWFDAAKCKTTSPVSVLQVHGDADSNVFYDGGSRHDVPYPSAPATVSGWAARNGCTGSLTTSAQRVDVEDSLAGNETRVEAFTGCPDGGAAELWTIEGGSHRPDFTDAWPAQLSDWLSAHPKP
jgi:polyhydroxybutyrate depolymerase